MVESRKEEVRSGDLRVRVESVGCGVGACWSCVGGGEAASAAGPKPPQPHLRSRDELAGEDVGCDVSWAYLGGVWRYQWPMIWGGLCEDIVTLIPALTHNQRQTLDPMAFSEMVMVMSVSNFIREFF